MGVKYCAKCSKPLYSPGKVLYCLRHPATCKPPHGLAGYTQDNKHVAKRKKYEISLSASEYNYISRHKHDYDDELTKLRRKIEVLEAFKDSLG